MTRALLFAALLMLSSASAKPCSMTVTRSAPVGVPYFEFSQGEYILAGEVVGYVRDFRKQWWGVRIKVVAPVHMPRNVRFVDVFPWGRNAACEKVGATGRLDASFPLRSSVVVAAEPDPDATLRAKGRVVLAVSSSSGSMVRIRVDSEAAARREMDYSSLHSLTAVELDRRGLSREVVEWELKKDIAKLQRADAESQVRIARRLMGRPDLAFDLMVKQFFSADLARALTAEWHQRSLDLAAAPN